MIKRLRPEDVWHPKRGAPKGNRNRLTTGNYTRENRELRSRIAKSLQRANAMVTEIERRFPKRKPGPKPGSKRGAK